MWRTYLKMSTLTEVPSLRECNLPEEFDTWRPNQAESFIPENAYRVPPKARPMRAVTPGRLARMQQTDPQPSTMSSFPLYSTTRRFATHEGDREKPNFVSTVLLRGSAQAFELLTKF